MAVYSSNAFIPLVIPTFILSLSPPHKMYLYIHATKMYKLLKVRWPRAVWGNLKMHLGPWTCFLLPLIPLSMDRLYTNTSVPNYNEQRYITDGLCTCLIYFLSVHSWERDPSLVVPLQLFFFFPIKGFLHFSWPGLRVWQRMSQL